MLAPMARREDDDEAAPSLLPTFVATRADGARTRLRAPDETAERDTHPDHRAVDEEVELEPTALRVEPTGYLEPTAVRPDPSGLRRPPALAAGMTRSLMAADRVDARSVETGQAERGAGQAGAAGTLSLGPSSTQDATPPTTLPSRALQRARLTSAAPRPRPWSRQVVVASGLLGVIVVAAWVLLTPPPLPPLPPLPPEAAALAGLPTAELSVLARDLVFPGTEGLRAARATSGVPEPAAPTSVERDAPPRPRARDAEASPGRVGEGRAAAGRGADTPRREAEPVAPTASPPRTTDTPSPPTATAVTTPVGADATLSITTRVSGSPVANVEIVLDGRVVGRSPLRLSGVRPGRHELEARGPHGSARKVVDIAPGSMEKLALELTTP